MTTSKPSDLSLKDIRFLRAVRDINSDPSNYEETDPGKTAANITAVTRATSLSKDEVDYRMTPGPNKKGFGTDQMGLIRIHEAQIEGGTFGPKSAELTEKGEKMLSNAIEALGLGDADTSETADQERIAEVDARTSELMEKLSRVEGAVEELDEAINDVSEVVQDMEDSEMGALDSRVAQKLNVLINALPLHNLALESVLGVDMDKIKDIEGDELDQETRQELREDVRETLNIEGEGGDLGDEAEASSNSTSGFGQGGTSPKQSELGENANGNEDNQEKRSKKSREPSPSSSSD